MINMAFNATAVPPSTGPEVLPTGIYAVKIVKSEELPVNNKPGCTYYAFTMQVIEGEHKGKNIIERLNCKNDNQQAVDIAYSTLSAICHVTGVMQVSQSSTELHDRPFKVSVVKVPRNDDPTRERNEIRGYMDMNGNAPGTNQAAVSTASQAAAFGTQPVQSAPVPQQNGPVPAPPPAPAAPAAALPPVAVFPPEGWTAHPQSSGYYYKGQEVLTEAQLRARVEVPAAPAAPTPPTPPTPQGNAAGQGQPVVPSWAQ